MRQPKRGLLQTNVPGFLILQLLVCNLVSCVLEMNRDNRGISKQVLWLF